MTFWVMGFLISCVCWGVIQALWFLDIISGQDAAMGGLKTVAFLFVVWVSQRIIGFLDRWNRKLDGR